MCGRSDGDTVEPGHVYRVVGCDQMAVDQHCIRSRIFWAPVVLPKQNIPASVRMIDDQGQDTWAAVSENLSIADRLRQLNVYRFVDILSRNEQLSANDMTPPPEHSHEPGFPHKENLIHHDIYQQFEAFRRYARDRFDTRDTRD